MSARVDVDPAGSTKLYFGLGRQIPLILESSQVDSGRACLEMIAGYLGHELNRSTPVSRHPVAREPTTLERLIEIAHAMDLQARPFRIDVHTLSRVRAPYMLQLSSTHFVIVKAVRGNEFTVHDPRMGVRVLTLNTLVTESTGVAIELTSARAFRPRKPQRALSIRTLMGGVQGLWQSLSQIFILAVVLEVLGLLAPLFVQIVADQILANGDADLLAVAGIGFLVLVLLRCSVAALRTWSVACLGARVNLAWGTNVFRHLLELPESYFLNQKVGDIVSRVESVNTIQQTLNARFVEVMLDGAMASFTLILLLVYSPWLATITLVAFLLYCAVRASFTVSLNRASMSRVSAAADQQSVFLEALRGVRAVKLHNQIGHHVARFANASAEALNRDVILQRFRLGFKAVNDVVFGFHRVAVLWVGASLVLRGQMTLGMLLAFVGYSDQFTVRASGLTDYLVDLQMVRVLSERLADIVLEEPERFVESKHSSEGIESSIEFRDVSFRYSEGSPWVLRNFSAFIRAGESVAFVGPSGCGKSTIVKLIAGLVDPQGGAILVGGIDLKVLGKARVRDMVGVVMQDDHLFAGSFADNICLFSPGATQPRIEEAARAASIHEEIVATSDGYGTLLGDMGYTLSGGQKQRLILARELYRTPAILVLDEATSHLDVQNERLVNDSIKNMNVTRVILAHRPETIAAAGRTINVPSSAGQHHGSPDA
jgi:ATP-binding cassette subfamily B protein RaxB